MDAAGSRREGRRLRGLLEKNAADVKGGAGQYFTLRALISAIVDAMCPAPGLHPDMLARYQRAVLKRVA
jgi:hypothetical protein